ncbi:MAG: acyl-CoA dehydratase activase-related protein, partial [Candidatus Kariarchaeaceae archaeon]
FILQKAFPDIEFITPSLNFLNGYEDCNEMIDYFTEKFNFRKDIVEQAYQAAVHEQLRIEHEMRILGSQALAEVIENGTPAIILVGRSYNAFPKETSQSIGRKLASKGIITIPYDCLGNQQTLDTSWYFSNLILDAVKLTKKHKNLFLLYISNFGCNIDTFTQEYLRNEIGTKPYLKLDIDSHTADAGTQTRIEAFLEIIENYNPSQSRQVKSDFQPAEIFIDRNNYQVRSSAGETMPLNDSRIKYHFPVFSKYHNETAPIAFRWMGYQAPKAIDLSVDQINLGLQYSSGSECLPFPIYIGQLLTIYKQKKAGDIIGLYMIPGGEPCVITAYYDIIKQFIIEQQLKDVFLFSPHETNDYYKISKIGLFRHFPFAITLADIMIEIHNVLETIGETGSIELMKKYWNELMEKSDDQKEFHKKLPKFVAQLSTIPIKDDPKNYPKVVVTGDFFVRFDPFFFKGLLKKYAENGIILKPVDLSELLLYPGYDDLQIYGEQINTSPNTKRALLKAAVLCKKKSSRKYLETWLSIKVLERFERNVRAKFESSGLLIGKENQIGELLGHASEHIDPTIYGESILTVGKAAEAMISGYQGILVVGPFSCLPFRISESIIKPISMQNNFPFLSYETDGRSVPPAFLRLVDVHIQQVLREWNKEQEDYEFTELPVVENV